MDPADTPSPAIVFLDAATLELDFSALGDLGDLTLHATTEADQTAARIQSADIVITNKVVLDREKIRGANRLRLIAVVATGTDNVDLDAARESGVRVCNVSGYSTESVAQHAVALLLNLATNAHRYAGEVEKWAESPIFTRLDHSVSELSGKLCGIVGVGAIGARVGEIAAALGMRIQCLGRENSSRHRGSEWPRLGAGAFFRTSDVVTLHCPLTPDTERMIDAEILRRMKPSGFLVNTGRGKLVDERALVDALREREIAGAALDVLSVEPPPPDHPLLAPDIPNLLITPHTAWISSESRQRLMDELIANIRAFLSGASRNLVSR